MIYEVFTWPWLRGLSERDGREVTLADVPDADWDALCPPGVTAVWLMGVWQRSAVGRAIALEDPSVRAAALAALPDATDDDIVGSAYCIRAYEVDARLGGDAGLAAARTALAARGLRLLLDFVPNHVAPDHPWVDEHPEFFVHGTDDDVRADPSAWFETSHGPVAHGRDPNFPPWTDVVQLDPMSSALRDAVVETLVSIAARCDGVRCDVAMLVLDDVAERTWGGRIGPRLYDRLAHEDAASVRAHLVADPAWQSRLVRFLENHDEPRAAATFPHERYRAAAVSLLTLPGTPLLYNGQLEGARVRTPVQLGRSPVEPVDVELAAFWRRLLGVISDEDVRRGEWRLLDVDGWPDNRTHEQLLAWRWERHVVVVNFGDGEADGRVRLGPELAGATWILRDLLGGEVVERDGDDLARHGLYVRLAGWATAVLATEPTLR